MNTEKKRKTWVMPTVVGVIALLAAVLIIVFVELMPNVSASNGLKSRHDEIKEAELKSVTLFDPNFGNDLAHQGGTEKSATLKRAENLRELMLPVLYNAVYSESTADGSLNDFDCRVRFKTEEHSTTIYIKGDRIYYTDSGKRHYFTVDNAEAFSDLKAYINEFFEQTALGAK